MKRRPQGTALRSVAVAGGTLCRRYGHLIVGLVAASPRTVPVIRGEIIGVSAIHACDVSAAPSGQRETPSARPSRGTRGWAAPSCAYPARTFGSCQAHQARPADFLGDLPATAHHRRRAIVRAAFKPGIRLALEDGKGNPGLEHALNQAGRDVAPDGCFRRVDCRSRVAAGAGAEGRVGVQCDPRRSLQVPPATVAAERLRPASPVFRAASGHELVRLSPPVAPKGSARPREAAAGFSTRAIAGSSCRGRASEHRRRSTRTSSVQAVARLDASPGSASTYTEMTLGTTRPAYLQHSARSIVIEALSRSSRPPTFALSTEPQLGFPRMERSRLGGPRRRPTGKRNLAGMQLRAYEGFPDPHSVRPRMAAARSAVIIERCGLLDRTERGRLLCGSCC